MLKLTIPGQELFDDETQEFSKLPDITLQLEHSLVSISKWEANWCKPFLDGKEKTNEEIIDYIHCMMLDEDVDMKVIGNMTADNFKEINKYIEAPMTATTFSNMEKSYSREIITSELIYYWMVSYNIPFECQHWHLNRLLTLIKVCNVKNNPPKKMSKQELVARNRALNQARREKMNSKG